MITRFAAAALVALALPAAHRADAHAAGTTPVDLADTPADLVVARGWALDPAARSQPPDVLATLRGPGGLHATVARLATPNPRAWRADKRDAYLAEVIEGFAAHASGRVVVSRPAGPVPTLDLDFFRASPRELVRVRVLLFRTYTLAMVIAGPSSAARAQASAISALRGGFALPAGWQAPS